MSAIITYAHAGNVSYFTDRSTDPGFVRLTAAVVQCGTPSPAIMRPRASMARTLLNFLGVRRRAPADDEFPELPAGWNSGTGLGSGREILYSEARRRVRVANTEFACPDDDALVVLVAYGKHGEAATIETLTVKAPPLPGGNPASLFDKNILRDTLMQEMRAQGAAWSAAVNDNPAVRAFLDHHRTQGQ